jgi:hypothetical protein
VQAGFFEHGGYGRLLALPGDGAWVVAKQRLPAGKRRAQGGTRLGDQALEGKGDEAVDLGVAVEPGLLGGGTDSAGDGGAVDRGVGHGQG